MCGIAGLVVPPGQAIPAGLPAMFDRLLAHRGPDDRGFLFHGGGRTTRSHDPAGPAASVVLVHRRLAILDLSPAGWQPMSTPDGNWHIVFNGEIYNYRELRDELTATGCSFTTGSDTEVLLQGLARDGIRFLDRVIGMFAFALLDIAGQRLMLARDFFGIKPLYLARWRDGLAFASEIKPLLDLPGTSRRADWDRCLDYLRFGHTDRDERTMFAAVDQLRPGHWLDLDLRNPTWTPQQPYWTPRIGPPTADMDSLTAQCRAAFQSSVALHMRSDVPLGFALSGGLDSTSVVAAARELAPAASLQTFSFVDPGSAGDETYWIQAASQALGVANQSVTLAAASLRSDFASWMRIQEEPPLAGGAYAQYQVMQLARQNGITVMLDGQGADEVFGGYSTSVSARIAYALRDAHFWEAAQLVLAASKLERIGFASALPQVLDHLPLPALQYLARAMLGRGLVPEWLNREELGRRGLVVQAPVPAADIPSFKAYLAAIATRLVLPRLLRYADRNSMAFSMELRVPFLNPRLLDFAYSLPDSALVSPRAEGKSLFRQSMRGLTPQVVLDRRNKIGFATRDGDLLRSDPSWSAGWLRSERLLASRMLNISMMKTQLDRFLEAGNRYDGAYFRWIAFACWAEELDIDLEPR